MTLFGAQVLADLRALGVDLPRPLLCKHVLWRQAVPVLEHNQHGQPLVSLQTSTPPLQTPNPPLQTSALPSVHVAGALTAGNSMAAVISQVRGLASYWSPVQYILRGWPPVGHL
jgi:hypothetical protein